MRRVCAEPRLCLDNAMMANALANGENGLHLLFVHHQYTASVGVHAKWLGCVQLIQDDRWQNETIHLV